MSTGDESDEVVARTVVWRAVEIASQVLQGSLEPGEGARPGSRL